jgi:hypothetical protein
MREPGQPVAGRGQAEMQRVRQQRPVQDLRASPCPCRLELGGDQLADNWQESLTFLQWSGPDDKGSVIARFIPEDEDTAGYKQAFREFVARAQDLPEARIIRPAWDAANYVRRTAERDLAVIEQTDVITTRCYLCRGGDGWVTGPIRPPAQEEAISQLPYRPTDAP